MLTLWYHSYVSTMLHNSHPAMHKYHQQRGKKDTLSRLEDDDEDEKHENEQSDGHRRR